VGSDRDEQWKASATGGGRQFLEFLFIRNIK
jgi:hypothetical protein